jgi:hypothetical protein
MTYNLHTVLPLATCTRCGDPVGDGRSALGYTICLPCGDYKAREARRCWTIAPMHKSNYTLVTSRDMLAGLNNKGGNVR